MWKKVLITFVAFMSTMGVVFALNRNMEAATGPEYYEPKDVFNHTDKNTFQMGGLTWWILYADQSGNGYIMADSISNKTYCDTANLE